METEGKLTKIKSSDVRAVVSLIMVGTFCALAFLDKVSPDDVVKVTLMIVGFYFGSKTK